MLSTIEDAIAAFSAGQFVIVADDEGRENEGDLILPAAAATDERIGFMIRHTSGVLCVPAPGTVLDRLALPLMVSQNEEPFRTAYAVSVDLRRLAGGTGISAADRAATIRALASTESAAEDFIRPGHIFPLRYRDGGVLARAGHTEATVDLSVLAGHSPVGVLAELNHDDGTMMRLPDLLAFGAEHTIPVITIEELIRYRLSQERLVERLHSTAFAKAGHRVVAHTYRWNPDGSTHVALVTEQLGSTPIVRVQRSCAAGDVFGSPGCDCGADLDESLRQVFASADGGVVVHITGGGCFATPAAADEERTHGLGAQILRDLGVTDMRLLTRSGSDYPALNGFGITIVDRVKLDATTVGTRRL